VVATNMMIVSPYLQGPEWFADGQHVLVIARSNNRPGNILYRVDVRTGEAEEVLPGSGSDTGNVYDVSPASGTVFARRRGNLNLLSIDVATGQTVTLVTTKASITAFASSPDGKRIAYLSWVDAARAGTGSEAAGSHLWMMPTNGGTPKEIFHDVNWNGGSRFNALEWTPDGRHLLFVRAEKQLNTLWRIPVEGGEPENLGLTMRGQIKSPFMHADGKTIYFTAAEADDNEVWALENFLPPASPGK
jgi:Tol biopolymer transport system component